MHDWIRDTIETTSGLTQKGLAECMGVNPAAVNRMLYGRRKIMIEEVPVIEAYLGTRFSQNSGENSIEYHQNRPEQGAQPSGFSDIGMGVVPISNQYMPNITEKIPVFGYGAQAGGILNLSNRDAVDWVVRHPYQNNIDGAFAVYVSSKSMEPRYYMGELVYIHPGRPPIEGRDCLVEMNNGDADVKRFIGQTETHIKVSQLNPEQRFSLKKGDIKAVYAVVGRG